MFFILVSVGRSMSQGGVSLGQAPKTRRACPRLGRCYKKLWSKFQVRHEAFSFVFASASRTRELTQILCTISCLPNLPSEWQLWQREL